MVAMVVTRRESRRGSPRICDRVRRSGSQSVGRPGHDKPCASPPHLALRIGKVSERCPKGVRNATVACVRPHQEASRLDPLPTRSLGCAAHAHSPREESREASAAQLSPRTRLPGPHSAGARSTACAMLCGANKMCPLKKPCSCATPGRVEAQRAQDTALCSAAACSVSTARPPSRSPAHPFARRTLCHTMHSPSMHVVQPLPPAPPPKLSSYQPLPHARIVPSPALLHTATPQCRFPHASFHVLQLELCGP